jgi:hypothetical protein
MGFDIQPAQLVCTSLSFILISNITKKSFLFYLKKKTYFKNKGTMVGDKVKETLDSFGGAEGLVKKLRTDAKKGLEGKDFEERKAQ